VDDPLQANDEDLIKPKKAIAEPHDHNLVTKLRTHLSSNRLSCNRLSEYMSLAELAIMQVISNVEDKRTFSTLSLIKSKFQNRPSKHLNTIIHMYAQQFYTLEISTFHDAIIDWEKPIRFEWVHMSRVTPGTQLPYYMALIIITYNGF
jgi:hypothetical protein